MGWAHIQDTGLGEQSSGTSQATGAFASANVLGNWVIVFAWGWNTSSQSAAGVTCSDNGSPANTYTQLKFVINVVQPTFVWCTIFIAKINNLPVSGNLNITVTVDVAASGIICCASEFSGGSRGTNVIESISFSGSATGQPNAGVTSTQSLDALVVAVCISNDTSNPGTISVPTHFTSVQSELNGGTLKMGNGCWWITSGNNVNTTGLWTFDGAGSFGQAYSAIQLSLALAPLPPMPVNKGLASPEGNGA